MDKLYTPLHTVFLHFKKHFFIKALPLFIMLCSGLAVAAQCVAPPAPVVTPNPAFVCVGGPAVQLKTEPVPFCSGPINIAVPDNNVSGANSNIFVSGFQPGCSITGMSVTINMTHTRIGDMVFALKAPNGLVLNLDYRLSATGSTAVSTGFTNTRFSSVATVALSTGISPYTGVFKHDAILAPIGGFGPAGPTGYVPTATNWVSLWSAPNGSWSLGFYDGATGETGTLNSWCIDFTTSCASGGLPGIWTPFIGLYYDATATAPYTGLAVNTVYALPSPTPGIYVYSVTVPGSSGSPLVSFTNSTAISIPVVGAANAYPANVSVSGLPVSGVKVKSVVLHDLNHTQSEDLDILLQSPTGTNLILMSDAGSGNTGTVTYTFTDDSPAMSVTANNATGSYKPTNFGSPDNFPTPGPGAVVQGSSPLSTFTGNFNGTWKLFVLDDDGSAGQGAIAGGFTINFDSSSVCYSPPTSVIVNVNTPAVITTQPVNQNVCTDKVANFIVVANNAAATYQWQITNNGGATFLNIANGGVYSGANTATLTITNPPLSMSGSRYRVVINAGSACGAAISNIAILTVNPVPVVSFYPHPYHMLLPGLTTTLSSTVSPATAATYTWFLDGVAIPGATADSFVVDFDHIGIYKLQVTDINGCTGVSDTLSIRDSAHGKMFVYPNPSTGKFQVRLYTAPNTPTARALVVYNNMGHKILTTSYTQTAPYQKVVVDVRKNGKGIYWVEVVDKDGKRISISKILIQ
ncbi:T9SS type A sorting domain-containing protein [Ferruginibacter sp.]